jgi:predicted ATPase
MFDHAKSREDLYEKISSPLKREYHERVAEQIENASKDFKEISLGDLAYHYSQAGNQEKSVKYSLAAGQDALARFSNKEAINHLIMCWNTLLTLMD